MKKLILLFVSLFVGVFVYAQTTPAPVDADGYVRNDAYQYIWGSTADTATNADTVSFVWRIKGGTIPDINIKLYLDHVSGTGAGTFISYSSIDGVNYEATGDTITSSSVTADIMDSEVLDLPDFLYPYLKVTRIQSGTVVTVPKPYIYVKLN